MTTTAFTDAELLAQAREGDETAFAELYVRHEPAARRLANSYARAGDPDDLVNEAFERLLKALRKGLGPTDAFRAYLFVTLRRLATDRIARSHDDPFDEMPEPVRAAAHDPGLDSAERALVVDAYESLPSRWQTVLWHTAIEGRQPRELAPALGMSANAAAALAYRAREKLRQAYLQAHLQAAPHPECEPHRSRLGAYVRDGLGARDRGATERHIDACSSCRGLMAELADVNRLLVGSLVPIFASAAEVTAVLAAATGAATGAGAGAGTGAGGALRGAGRLGRRTWSKARSNPGPTTAVIGALLVAAVIAGALIAARDDQVALPAPPDEPAPPGSGPETPEVPLIVAPPARADPIAASEPPPPTEPPPTDPVPAPATAPPTTIARSTTPSTRVVPPTTSPTPPFTEPPPDVPPPPTTTTPPPTTTAPPPDEPCTLHIQIGGVLDLQICLTLPLLGG